MESQHRKWTMERMTRPERRAKSEICRPVHLEPQPTYPVSVLRMILSPQWFTPLFDVMALQISFAKPDKSALCHRCHSSVNSIHYVGVFISHVTRWQCLIFRTCVSPHTYYSLQVLFITCAVHLTHTMCLTHTLHLIWVIHITPAVYKTRA